MKNIKEFISIQKGGQIFSLLLSNFLGLPLGILISILLAKILGPEEFGSYSLLINIFTFGVLISSLGLFYTINRAILLAKSIEDKRNLYGVGLVFLFLIFLLVSAFLIIYALVDTNIYEKKLNIVLLSIVPIGFVFLINNYFDIILPADNKIKYLSIYRLSSKVLHLIFLGLYYLFIHKNIVIVSELILLCYIFFISYVLSGLGIFYKLNPEFINMKKNMKSILSCNKEYGFNLYVGGVVAVGFVSLTPILIGYFSSDNKGIGFFTLALTFCAPIAIIPNTIGTVYYKKFSKGEKISLNAVYLTWIIGFISTLLLVASIDFLVKKLYGNNFYEVIDLVYIMSLGFLIHGVGDFYNKFLSANGESVVIRNNAFFVGLVSVLIGVILIPIYGIYGAAYSRVIIGVIYLSLIYRCYLIYLKKKDFIIH